jgi:hypothetical protein
MPTTELRTKEQLFAEMSRLVNTNNFNLAARDQFDRVKTLFDIATSSDAGEPTYNRWHQRTDAAGIVELRRRCHEALKRDPAALEFFSRSAHRDEPVVSDYGTKITKGAYHMNGRSVGTVVQMRTYSGLDTGTSGDAGGFSTPILFWIVNKYIEVFMVNHQIGFEGAWRVDGQLLKASGTDAPIIALRQPLS